MYANDMSEKKKREMLDSLHKFTKFRTALITESDRGCALFAASYLDKALEELLEACMVQHKKMREELFTGQSPLSTFSSKIKMAYYLGKIAESERRDLETIRSIRNEFAHDPEKLTFENQSIKARCNNLKHSWREKSAAPRTKFNATVTAILLNLMIAKIESSPAIIQPERPMPEEVKQAGLAAVSIFTEATNGSKNP